MTERTRSLPWFHGLTAAEMNAGAIHGKCTKEDLEEWAQYQNPFLASIEWLVVEQPAGRGISTPMLLDRKRSD